MITIKSNIGEVIKSFQSKVDKINNVINTIASKVAEKVKNRIIEIYQTTYIDPKDNLSLVGKADVVVRSNGNSYIVGIGENSETLTMADGEKVNPYFFIEFGFGIIGESNPTAKASSYSWQYNVNKHKNYWWYYSQITGKRAASRGMKGGDAFSKVIAEFNTICATTIDEVLASL